MNTDKTEYNWKNKTVLITEDIDLNYMFLEKILAQSEIKVIRAKDGYEALQIIKNNPAVDIILMDVQMPGIDGFETTIAIKKIQPNLPIILQTAYLIDEGRDKGFKSGANEYVEKPINVNKLFVLMEKHL